MTLTDTDIEARLALLDTPTAKPVASEHGRYRFYQPLVNEVDEWRRFALDKNRIFTGIEAFDTAMRGLGKREMMLCIGHTHQGKTLLATQIVVHNHNRRIVWFTPDETRQLVLIKLASLVHGISAEEMEERMAAGDETVADLMRSTATEHFPNLVVFDEITDLDTMTRAIEEVEEHWGATTELCVFDYAELLDGSEEGGDKAKIKSLKGWGRIRDVALLVLHQTSRSKGSDGQQITIDSGFGGGEALATFSLGVRRKRSFYQARLKELREKEAKQIGSSEGLTAAIADCEFDLQTHQNTVTFNLVKSKRPPSRLVDDLDFLLDQDTGRISPFDQAFSKSTRVESWFEQSAFDEENF